MCYDKDIHKYKGGPAVTTLSDEASPNVERIYLIVSKIIYQWALCFETLQLASQE